ncbi:MAG: diguanylate cyclase [Nitrobacter vulgaris]|nr:diguanylate cyclase [Nitrobacter vulgaris]
MVQHSHGPNDLGDIEVNKSETGFIHYALDVTAIVAITNVQGTITHVNNKFCEISGYSQHELIGQNHRLLRSDAHDKTFFREMYRQIARGQVWRGEICNRRKDGTTYWVDTTIVPHLNAAGNPDSYTSIRFDVTRRHQIEEDLRHAVSTDALTGTANRRRFQEYLTATLELRNSIHTSVYLALIDIDAFKEINDTFGHVAGDNLLKNFAERLRAFEAENISLPGLAATN